MADRPGSAEIQMDMLYDDRTDLPLYAGDAPPSRFCTLALVSAHAFRARRLRPDRKPRGLPQAGDRSQERQDRRHAGRRHEPGRECVGGAETAGGREHGDRDRNSGDAAEKSEHVEDAGRLADLVRATEFNTRALCGGHAIETPAPERIKGAISLLNARSGAAISAIQDIPMACRMRPATIRDRSPIRLTRLPATGATTNSIAVHGSKRSPAPSGP